VAQQPNKKLHRLKVSSWCLLDNVDPAAQGNRFGLRSLKCDNGIWGSARVLKSASGTPRPGSSPHSASGMGRLLAMLSALHRCIGTQQHFFDFGQSIHVFSRKKLHVCIRSSIVGAGSYVQPASPQSIRSDQKPDSYQ
jgi:hypothetical protein